MWRGAAPDLGPEVVGREAELAQVHAFLDAGSRPGALRPRRRAGIGKTTLWETRAWMRPGSEAMRVLVARPSDAEARLAFSSLIDLFDGVTSEELAGLPAPQLHALDVALLRAVSAGARTGGPRRRRRLPERAPRGGGARPDPRRARRHPVARRFLCLRAHLRRAAARRRPRSAFLLARRPGLASPLEQALEPRGVERLEPGPLSLGAIRRVLRDRLGLSVSRQLLRRIYDATLGNALFALEVGRKLVDEGLPGIGDDLPVPDAVEALLGLRVDRLPKGVRRLLLAVALSPICASGSSPYSPTRTTSTSQSRAASSSSPATTCAPRIRFSPRRSSTGPARRMSRAASPARRRCRRTESSARAPRPCRRPPRSRSRGRGVGCRGAGGPAAGRRRPRSSRRSRLAAHATHRPESWRSHPRTRRIPRGCG